MNLDISPDRGRDRHVHVMYPLRYYKKCYSCVLSTGRCDGFVVACGTGSWLRDSPPCHRWMRGRHCDNVTVYSEYNPSMSPRRRRCHFKWCFRHWWHWKFSLWKSPVLSEARVGIAMTASASRRTTSELLIRTQILISKQLPNYIAKSLFHLLIPYVFHFKYLFYKYDIDFWALRN